MKLKIFVGRGIFEQYPDDYVTVENLTNSTLSQCNKLVDDSELEDGRIPQALGISFGLWLVCCWWIGIHNIPHLVVFKQSANLESSRSMYVCVLLLYTYPTLMFYFQTYVFWYLEYMCLHTLLGSYSSAVPRNNLLGGYIGT